MKQTRKKKHLSGYGKFLIAFACVMAAIVCAALFWVYGALARFETTTPRAAILDYFAALSAGNLEPLKEASGFEPDELNTWNDYFSELKRKFSGDAEQFDFRQVMTADKTIEQVYAVYDGEKRLGELVLRPNKEAEHGYSVSAPAVFTTAYKVTAPGHVTVLANGTPLAKDGEDVVKTEVAGFESLPEDQRPVMYEYTLPPAIKQPQFAAESTTGGEVLLDIDDEAHTVKATVALTPEEEAACKDRMQTVAMAYSAFITGDSGFDGLSQYLVPGTPLYENTSTYYNGWYLDHEDSYPEDVNVTNLLSLSETCFSGDIQFTYVVMREGVQHTFPSNYYMNFTGQPGAWLLLDMQTR